MAADPQAGAESGQCIDSTAAEALAPNPSLDPEDARLYLQPRDAAAALDPEDAALYRQEAEVPAPSPSLDPEDAELYRGLDIVPGAFNWNPLESLFCSALTSRGSCLCYVSASASC